MVGGLAQCIAHADAGTLEDQKFAVARRVILVQWRSERTYFIQELLRGIVRWLIAIVGGFQGIFPSCWYRKQSMVSRPHGKLAAKRNGIQRNPRAVKLAIRGISHALPGQLLPIQSRGPKPVCGGAAERLGVTAGRSAQDEVQHHSRNKKVRGDLAEYSFLTYFVVSEL